MSPVLGRRVARFNRKVTNRLSKPVARWLPGFGVVVHIGRRSQRRYETPVNVFFRRDEAVIALTYGIESEWLKNVLSAGGCELVTRGRSLELTSPVVRHDDDRKLVPAFVRPMLRLLRVADFVCLTIAAGDDS